MVKRSKKPVASYKIWIEPEVYKAKDILPGKIRQRIKREIDHLAGIPRPDQSLVLDTEDLEVPLNTEIRRLRLDQWRVIYALNDKEKWIWVLAIRQRPPYDYQDLPQIVANLTK